MKYEINLFPQKEFNIADKLIFFTFHYLRYILVITQLVVIGVFFYRFKVDQEIVDLKDSLHQKQEIVSISTPLLQEVAVVDKKVGGIMKIKKDQDTFLAMTDYLLSLFPEKLNLTKLYINGNQIEFDGNTTDADAVRVFYYRLKKENKFKQVNLSALSKGDLGYKFTFRLGSYSMN